jgi:hypothetical protein
MSDLADDELRARLKYAMGERHLESFVEPLRELQRHRAARAADAERVRAAVRDAAYDVLCLVKDADAIADRVVSQLGPVALSIADRVALQGLRDGLARICLSTPGSRAELAALDRLLGAAP